jgi:hypothetical protein
VISIAQSVTVGKRKMSLIKKIVEIVDRTESVDARKNIAKLNKDIKSYKEKVKQ